MKLGVYVVYDVKADVYSQPMLLTNDQVAIRIITNCVNKKGHNYNLNPEDYYLYRMGDYEDNTGRIEQPERLELITSAIAVVRKEIKK